MTTKEESPAEKAMGAIVGGNAEIERWDNILNLANLGRFEEIDAQTQVLYGDKLEAQRARYLRRMRLKDTFENNYWYVGPTPWDTSRKARSDYPDAYVKTMDNCWRNYENQETVILDNVDPTSIEKMAQLLETWLDHYPFMCEVKGRLIWARPRRFVVTSIYTINECFGYMNVRFKQLMYTKQDGAPQTWEVVQSVSPPPSLIRNFMLTTCPEPPKKPKPAPSEASGAGEERFTLTPTMKEEENDK